PASLSRSGRPSRCVAGSRMESLSLHAALRIAVIGLDWLVALPVVCAEPSPHVIVYAQGASFTPASLKVALKVNAVPAVAVWLAPAFTSGATLAIVAVVFSGELSAPSEPVTLRV